MKSAPPDQLIGSVVATQASSPRGRRFLAASASLLLTGLGHALARRWRRGLCWFGVNILLVLLCCVAAACPALTPALFILLPLTALFTIAVVIDACIVARRTSTPMFTRPAFRYALGIVFLIASFFLSVFYRCVAVPINRYVAQSFVTPTHAMTPALEPGDRFLISRLVPYSRWSMVVFRWPVDGHTFFVMRITGLPGETVEVKNGGVLINGHSIPQPVGIHYLGNDPRILQGGNGKPMKLGPDEYFVLGDNSPISNDSRHWNKPAPGHQRGALPAASIVGPVTWIYWPMNRIRRVYRSVPLTVPAP
jgi:signal peptidase I